MAIDFQYIKKYIPQREPMIMVERLLKHERGETISTFHIEEENVLLEGSFFSEAGLLENMAQTAALGKGYEFVEKNEKPPLGFIGAVKNFEVFDLPPIGSKITTRLQVKHEVLNASVVDAEVSMGETPVARCQLKIFINPQLPEDEKK